MSERTNPDNAGSREAENDEDGEETEWYTGWRGPLILVLYILLTLVAMTISSREFSFSGWLAGVYRVVVGWILIANSVFGEWLSVQTTPPNWLINRSDMPALQTTIPADVYLFGLAGAVTRFLLSFVTDIAALTAPVRGDNGESYGTENNNRSGRGVGNGDDRENLEGGGDDGEGRQESGNSDESGAGVDDAKASELELLRLVLGIPAAVYLSAGVFLIGTQLTSLFQRFETQVLFVIASYVAGFYVRRTYLLLGDVADRLLASVEEEEKEEEEEEKQGSMFAKTFNLLNPPKQSDDEHPNGLGAGENANETSPNETASQFWYSGWLGKILFGLTVLLAFGVLFAILEGGPADGICASVVCFRIPLDIYLYSFMGGTGYVFTKLFVDIKRSRRSVIESSVRIFAGVFLAVGIYILFDPTTGTASAVAFLTGLYLNVAVLRFDALAEQFFARFSRTIRSENEGNGN